MNIYKAYFTQKQHIQSINTFHQLLYFLYQRKTKYLHAQKNREQKNGYVIGDDVDN